MYALYCLTCDCLNNAFSADAVHTSMRGISRYDECPDSMQGIKDTSTTVHRLLRKLEIQQ